MKDILKITEGSKIEGYVWAEHLRAEAVKWIKEIDNFKKSSEDLMWEEMTGKTIEYSKDSICSLRNWIKHFFNLTEEDLKYCKTRL